jgi:pimeloyl-ACP methyl ester carboxylesterase
VSRPTQRQSGRRLPALAGVSHHFVDVGGVGVHVAEAGGGEPVMLLHGFGQHWYAWHRVVPLLADRYRLICPDLVGYGWSATPRHGYGTAQRVRWLLDLLDVLSLRRVGLVGHETGGWLACMVALQHPERVSHLAALNVPAPWTQRRRLAVNAWRNWYTGILEQPFIGRMALKHWAGFDRFLLSHYATSHDWDSATLDEFVTAMREPGCARGAEIQHRRFVFEDIKDLALGRYRHQLPTMPSLFLGGERDFFVPPRLLRAANPAAGNIRVRVVAGAGHYLAEEHPDAVTREVIELLARPPVAAGPSGETAGPRRRPTGRQGIS